MGLKEFIAMTGGAILAHRLRSFLTMLGITVGIAAVTLLTSIGEGIHKFVLDEFTQFGTNLIAITAGNTQTHGIPGVFRTVRPLSLDDSEAMRRLPNVLAVVPFIQGNAEVEAGKKGRHSYIYGVGPEVPQVWRFKVAAGRFLPPDDPRAARAYVVLGAKVARELFPNTTPLGQRIRIGTSRYRVIGVMEVKGQFLGFDMDDAVYIPAARAMELFNRNGLMEIDILYKAGVSSETVVKNIKRMLIARHGREDFTIITQDQMLETLGSILNVLTFAVAAIGSISLFVGGVGIFTIMTIAVNERISEIGLLRALGARQGQILVLFLGEATILSVIGGITGLVIGTGGAWLLSITIPALPVHTPWVYVFVAMGAALAIGLIAGVLPAHRAARLDPVEALRTE